MTQKTPIQRLCRAVELGFQKMQVARDARYKFLAQYVGPFYSKSKGSANSDERKASPINLMWNGVTTLVPNLVYNDPRVKVRTEVMAYRPYAGTLELATNHLIRKIKLRHTLRKVITDALFAAFNAMAPAQGTMNNFTFGNDAYQYYETIAGGSGAGPGFDGTSVIQTHMTNSRKIGRASCRERV